MKTWKLIMLMFCTSEGNVEGGRKENREILIPENGSNKAEEVDYSILSYTVDYDVSMDISRLIVIIGMSNHQ